jgi:hypothetical protein
MQAATECNSPEDVILHSHYLEEIKSYNFPQNFGKKFDFSIRTFFPTTFKSALGLNIPVAIESNTSLWANECAALHCNKHDRRKVAIVAITPAVLDLDTAWRGEAAWLSHYGRKFFPAVEERNTSYRKLDLVPSAVKPSSYID